MMIYVVTRYTYVIEDDWGEPMWDGDFFGAFKKIEDADAATRLDALKEHMCFEEERVCPGGEIETEYHWDGSDRDSDCDSFVYGIRYRIKEVELQ